MKRVSEILNRNFVSKVFAQSYRSFLSFMSLCIVILCDFLFFSLCWRTGVMCVEQCGWERVSAYLVLFLLPSVGAIFAPERPLHDLVWNISWSSESSWAVMGGWVVNAQLRERAIIPFIANTQRWSKKERSEQREGGMRRAENRKNKIASQDQASVLLSFLLLWQMS